MRVIEWAYLPWLFPSHASEGLIKDIVQNQKRNGFVKKNLASEGKQRKGSVRIMPVLDNLTLIMHKDKFCWQEINFYANIRISTDSLQNAPNKILESCVKVKKVTLVRFCLFDRNLCDRREIIVRGQSYFSRLPKYWPPIPRSARRVCPPPATEAYTLARRRGGWGVNILEDERNRIALLQWSLYAVWQNSQKQWSWWIVMIEIMSRHAAEPSSRNNKYRGKSRNQSHPISSY
jgi:hypothetical protein